VRRIARRVRHLFTHHIDIEELEQAGYVGLVSAANTYDPRRGAFAPYSYWRVRGEMIDSQKRRAFREAQHESLDAIADTHGGPPRPQIDVSPAPRVDELLTRDEVSCRLESAVGLLELRQGPHARAFAMHVAGVPPREIARRLGLSSPTTTRAVIREAQEFLAHQLEAS
jgi:RNA polymerase sigma factor (sigma-70 family)